MYKVIFPLLFAMISTTAFSQKVSKVKGEDFGAGIEAKQYVEYADMMNQLSTSDTVNVTVMAKVTNVCQAKGCWMTLQSGDAAEKEMMVKFKDYGFFVPKDISGNDVLIEGVAYSTTIPVDELRHYAEDAGKSADEIAKITEPETKYAFLASGVRVVR